MAVHMQQVHKSTLETVPNALEGRDSHALEISGMRGIPMDHEAARKRMRMAGAFDDIQTKQGDVVQNLNQPQLPPGMLPPSIPGFHVPPGMPSAPIGMPPFGLPPMMGMPPPISFQQNSVATSVTGPKVAQVGGSMVGDTPDVENIIHDLEGLIYRDEMISMEEKRAKLPKYRFDEEKIKAQLSDLDAAIGARLSQYIKA